MNEIVLIKMAENYLTKNEERFTQKEKLKFKQGFAEWLYGKSETINDEIYDFLIDCGVVKGQRREEKFVSYLNQKYSFIRFNKIMDVGAGRLCRLSRNLAKLGCKMHAIDPNIRLSQKEATLYGIKSIKTQKFICDDFADKGIGTNIQGFDLLVGLEPCDATEHIIRQGLKYDKPFEILLCAAAHDSLDGKKFRNYEEWYAYLDSLSTEVKINKIENSYYASNIEMQP